MTDNLKTSIFGYCPKCNGRGITRERRLDGNDRCENGHVYPSRDALVSKDDFQKPLAANDQLLEQMAEALDRLTKECILQGLTEKAGFDCWIAQADEALKRYREKKDG